MKTVYIIFDKEEKTIIAVFDNSDLAVEGFVHYGKNNKNLTILRFEINPSIPFKL